MLNFSVVILSKVAAAEAMSSPNEDQSKTSRRKSEKERKRQKEFVCLFCKKRENERNIEKNKEKERD